MLQELDNRVQTSSSGFLFSELSGSQYHFLSASPILKSFHKAERSLVKSVGVKSFVAGSSGSTPAMIDMRLAISQGLLARGIKCT